MSEKVLKRKRAIDKTIFNVKVHLSLWRCMKEKKEQLIISNVKTGCSLQTLWRWKKMVTLLHTNAQ